ncbi:MAG: glycosyl transferase, partial [Burkholderiaceae bacterium]
VTMGNWGQGARSALPMVGEVFQQAVRNKWIDARVEFDIPRPKARAPGKPQDTPEADNPLVAFAKKALQNLVDDVFERITREIRDR